MGNECKKVRVKDRGGSLCMFRLGGWICFGYERSANRKERFSLMLMNFHNTTVRRKGGLCCKRMSHLDFIVSVFLAYTGYIPGSVWWKGGLCCKRMSHLDLIVSVFMAYAGCIPGSVWFAS